MRMIRAAVVVLLTSMAWGQNAPVEGEKEKPKQPPAQTESAKRDSAKPDSAKPDPAQTDCASLPARPPESSDAPLTADVIMARVAENQDCTEALRKEYIYRQHTRVITHKPKGRLMREETADYDATPTPEGSEKTLKLLTGRYWNKSHGKYETFEGNPPPGSGSLDGGIINGFRDDLCNDKSKDGLAKDLFPFTTKEQEQYAFTLLGQETEDGRPVYRIAFRPKDRHDISWAGEAYIDAAEFQPVRVFTKLSRRIPFAVRTLLGTDVPGLGFNVVYKRQEDGVWFPATFGTEFRLRAVFFINRDISVALENTGFERTHVQSKMRMVGTVDDVGSH